MNNTTKPAFTFTPKQARRAYLKRELEELSLVIEWHETCRGGAVPPALLAMYDSYKAELLSL